VCELLSRWRLWSSNHLAWPG